MRRSAGPLTAIAVLILAGRLLQAAAPGHTPSTRWQPSDREPSDPGSKSFRPTCAPGPELLSQMAFLPGGYLKARSPDVIDARAFTFARAMYSEMRAFRLGSDWLGDGGPTWSIDYPLADRHMMAVATRLSNLDACEWEYPVALDDPDLRRFPFLYSLEWGYADFTEAEVQGLREYLLAGGFLMIDDTWGSLEHANLEYQLRRALPEYPVVDVPRAHLLFRSYYTIEGEIVQVPNAGNGRQMGLGMPGARTWERDGYDPHVRGVFDDTGRLMVVIFGNTDLGDALEWAEDPRYPLEYSTFASQIFLNTIIYAMTQ